MNALAPEDPVAAIFQRAVESDSELESADLAPARVEAAERFVRRLPVVQRGRYRLDVAAMMAPRPAIDSLRLGR